MCSKRRPRRAAVVILLCGTAYVIFFNLIALYGLIHSSTHSASWIRTQGNLFLGHLAYNNWTCKPLLYSKTALPVTALASFPGSGNTWVRHIIQEATGVATGSAYFDLGLKRGGFPGEGRTNGSVVVVKTHGSGSQERMKYEKAILLIRDPFDALLAEFNRKHGGHLGHAQKIHFKKYWPDYVYSMSDNWYEMNHDWLRFQGPLHVVVYGKLRENASEEIQGVLRFLNINVSYKDLLCVLKNFDGHFKRNKFGALKVNELFTKSMKTRIDKHKTRLTLELQNYLNRSDIKIS